MAFLGIRGQQDTEFKTGEQREWSNDCESENIGPEPQLGFGGIAKLREQTQCSHLRRRVGALAEQAEP
jgi:hypothetical protein